MPRAVSVSNSGVLVADSSAAWPRSRRPCWMKRSAASCWPMALAMSPAMMFRPARVFLPPATRSVARPWAMVAALALGPWMGPMVPNSCWRAAASSSLRATWLEAAKSKLAGSAGRFCSTLSGLGCMSACTAWAARSGICSGSGAWLAMRSAMGSSLEALKASAMRPKNPLASGFFWGIRSSNPMELSCLGIRSSNSMVI